MAHLVKMHQFMKKVVQVGTLVWRFLMFVEKAIYGHLQTFWKGILCAIQEEKGTHSPIRRVQRMESDVYKEDIVQCTQHTDLIGMVIKVADSNSTSGDSDDEYEEEPIPMDCARIVWTNLSETIEKISDIEVLDRVFFHGDIVASASDPSGQMGMVVNVELTLDLTTPTSVAIRNVSSRNLHRIRAFAQGDYVIHGPWLGRVDTVVDDVTVIFDDGSKCKLMKANPGRLIPISKNLHYPYVPGQRVRGSSSAVFKNGIWLCGEWKKNNKEATVCDVELGSVWVNWIAAANPGYDSQSNIIPAEQQDPEQLNLLSCFSYANWRLGDWCLLPRMSERGRSEVTLPATDDNVVHSEDNILDGVLSVGNRRTKVDVIWQDGTRTYGVDSRTLIPIYNLLEYDFFSEQYVLKKGSDDVGDASEARRVGVVKSVDSKERTARVRWLKAVDCPEDTCKFDGEELVSVYELAYHPDYYYFVGDVVIRLFPVYGETEVPGIVNQLVGQIQCKDETRSKNVIGTTDLSRNQKTLMKREKAELDKSLEESNLSWIGNVIGLKDGDIEVAWANGMVSKVGPQQIVVVRGDEDDASVCNNAEEDDKNGPAGWKTVDFDLVKLIFGNHDMEQKREEDTVHMEQKREENTVHSLPSSSCHDLGHFKQFDSVKDPMDHFYHQETNQHINKRKWMKKVQQEWNILQENLPDTIFVRIYEDRMDLLRAVIVGAAGTPYQDGLFFFDIHFPSQYPDVPPLVHYHSGGLSLNPNLYDTGKVCLSLLNTWTGRRNEVWNPSLSNVLQVLVSIQGLVLNANPYFNEPEYDKQYGSAKGEKDSLAYKENSFLLSCKSMLYILRTPPKHFEMFVKEHFQKRGHCILRACDAYVKGAQVGSLSEDCRLPSNVEAESESKSTTSAGFKLMLLKIVPKLISAFSEIGVDCQAFQESIAKESKGLGGL